MVNRKAMAKWSQASKRTLALLLWSIVLHQSCLTSVSAAFRDDFASARALGMGGAYLAVASDGDTILTNPSGIWRTAGQQFAGTSALLYPGLDDKSSIQQQLASYVYHGEDSPNAVGFLWKRLAVSQLYSENQYALAYARHYRLFRTSGEERSLRFAFTVGASVRLLRWDTVPTVGPDGRVIEDLSGPLKATFDLGFLIYPSDRASVALVFQNLNQPNTASTGSVLEEPQPINTRLGLALQSRRITWSLDLRFQRHQTDLQTGLEWQFIPNLVMLRGGVQLQNLAWGTNVMAGAGYLITPNVRLDYAFMQSIQGIDSAWGSHRMSLVYDF